MVEVFKTDVKSTRHAIKLLDQIHKQFSEYQANFDLDDCDNILRIQSVSGYIDHSLLIVLLKRSGFTAEVLQE
jgi:hypothetical protein